MNWSFIVLQVVALIGVVSFTIAGLYYVRHRHAKALSLAQTQSDSSDTGGGEFLKRYVPPEHRTGEVKVAANPMIASRTMFYASCILIPGLVLSMTGLSYYSNRTVFLKDIDLTDIEVSKLTAVEHTFTAPLNPYSVTLSEVIQSLNPRHQFVVMKSVDGNSHYAQSWKKLLAEAGASVSFCEYGRLKRCKIYDESTVIMWLADDDRDLASGLLKAGVSVIAYGVPKKLGNWHGLDFSAGVANNVDHLALVGDHELSLGIAAGTNFSVGRLRADVIVSSDNPQAISQFADQIAGGDIQTRLYARPVQKARLVWMDYAAGGAQYLKGESKLGFEAILANIVRYASDQTYESIASWPNGKSYAGFIEQDTEDGYADAVAISRRLKALNVPTTWYALSNLANRYRDVTVELAESGEMACHGDNHDIMPRYPLERQMERLARCIKVLEKISGERPVGFRPPTEAINNDTLSALLNVGISYLFAENSTSTQVPHLKTSLTTGESLVSLPRVVTDDFYLWHFLELNGEKSLERMHDELNWIRTAGTLYGFSFHSQFMSQDQYLDVVETIARDLVTDPDAFVVSNGELASWWRTRDAVLNGQPVNEALLNQFRPTKLRVNSEGELESTPWELLNDGEIATTIADSGD